jgi:hypothetical protein
MTERVQFPVAELNRIMQALHAMGAGQYIPGLLDDLIHEDSDLGRLARAVNSMARSVQLRARQAAGITETQYFRDLKRKACQLRDRNKD